jgi:hypothetical protein
MCFNGAKTWQLGWFSNFHVNLNPTKSIYWTGDLIGFVEKNNASSTDVMIIRIQSSISQDTYVHFNRQIGFNSGSQLLNGADKVLIATRPSYPELSPSTLTAILSGSNNYTFPNFHGSSNALIISVSSIRTNTIPARARIVIRFDANSRPTPYPSLSKIPSTKNPTSRPSNAPTHGPTPLPSNAPTRKPTSLPSGAPTPKPTSLPQEESLPTPTRPLTQNPTRFPFQKLWNPSTKLPLAKMTLSPARKPSPSRSPTRKRYPTRKPTKKRPSSVFL